MFELGCHIIDSVHRVLGKPKTVTPHIHKGKDGLADNMLAVLDYAERHRHRAQFHHRTGRRTASPVHRVRHEGLLRNSPARTASHDADDRCSLTTSSRKGTQEVPLEKAPRYAADWTEFAKAIRGQIEWEFNPEHDLAVQETVLLASGMKTA